jgi:hypothetical protein
MTRHVIVGGLAAALLATANRMGLLWGCSWMVGRHAPRGSDRGRR